VADEPGDGLRGDRRPHVAVVALLLLAAGLAVGVIAARGGGEPPPATGAARLVPADALVFVHLSTDPDRAAVRRARALAERFPGFAARRDRILRGLSVRRCGLSREDLRGKEAALALLDARGGTAGSLVLVEGGRDDADGAAQRRCGAVSVRRIGRYVAIGQPPSLAAAADVARGRAPALADDPLFRHATAGLPGDRVADAWASSAGIRRLLAPQPGLLGTIGALLDRPGLRGAAAALAAGDDRAELTVRSVLSGRAGAGGFAPRLVDDVPADAIAYLGTRGAGPALGRLLGAAGLAGHDVREAGAALADAVVAVRRALGRRLDGEVGLVLTPGPSGPALTLLAPAGDEAGARRGLRRAEPSLARAVRGGGGRRAFGDTRAGGTPARTLAGERPGLSWAVADGKALVSTRPDGIASMVAARGKLPGTDAYAATVGDTPDEVASLVFLDFSQLLRLGEQTGLGDERSDQAVMADLERVRAVGGSTSGAGDVTTAELVLSIP
jgi:hypothetical protein